MDGRRGLVGGLVSREVFTLVSNYFGIKPLVEGMVEDSRGFGTNPACTEEWWVGVEGWSAGKYLLW